MKNPILHELAKNRAYWAKKLVREAEKPTHIQELADIFFEKKPPPKDKQ